MNILVIGSGGREHALCWKLKQSPRTTQLFCAPGNAGIADIANSLPADVNDAGSLANLAEAVNADLTIAVEFGMILAALMFIRKVALTTTVSSVTADYVDEGHLHALQGDSAAARGAHLEHPFRGDR